MEHHDEFEHGSEHDSASLRAAGRKSTLVSVGVNIGLMLLQISVGLWAHSQALVADGIHSLSDLFSDFVVLLAGKYSHLDPDDEHQYGHYRFENAASMVLGAMLIMVGIGMLWNAFMHIQHTTTSQNLHLSALWIAIIALVSKELLFRYMLAIAKRIRSSLLIANAWHARSDAASSLIVAIGIIGTFAGFPLLDPIAALIVGLMVTKMGLQFFWSALNDLMDHAISHEEIVQIQTTLEATPGILGVHNLRTRRMGDFCLVDVHLEIDGQKTVTEGHAIALEARRRVMEDHQVLNVMTHVDPVDHCLDEAAH